MSYESVEGRDGGLRPRSSGKALAALAAAAFLAVGCFVFLYGSDGSDAETVTVNGIEYDVDTGTVTASVIGYDGLPVSLSIPSSVTYGDNEYAVTSIARGAFFGCSSLVSVTIPDSVSYVEEGAFYGCPPWNPYTSTLPTRSTPPRTGSSSTSRRKP